jgi:NAD(P)-dependent dehydrogenase (short-subunit alcohol dehydrogenase family)
LAETFLNRYGGEVVKAKLFDLEGRTILVTGAAGHLGEAISYQLAAAGARVILNGRSAEKLESLRNEIHKSGYMADILSFDITDQSAVVEALGTIDSLDGIVNNAYHGVTGTIELTTPEQMRDSLEINLTAPFFLIQRCLPLLRKSSKGGAAIVNIASMYGIVSPDPRIYESAVDNNPPFYGAGKAGLIQLTRYLACHLAHDNIRVNAVSPGHFRHRQSRSTIQSFIPA